MFTALQDGWVVAYNDETLEELWRFNVGAALKGAPIKLVDYEPHYFWRSNL